jgi:REP element-mobilizing transposase RayT
MANTYSQLYVHIVFAVEARASVLPSRHKEDLHRFTTGIVQNRGQTLIAINSMADHMHILIGQKPDVALSDLVRDIKAGSSKFINEKRWVAGRFNWQEGFGAFSYSHSQLQNVVRYIQNQEQHHQKKMFREEYVELLEKFRVDYDGKYIFHPVETGRP